jgi:hypothetical protein
MKVEGGRVGVMMVVMMVKMKVKVVVRVNSMLTVGCGHIILRSAQ